MSRCPSDSRHQDAEASAALELAERIARQEAVRLRCRPEMLDPEELAGLAVVMAMRARRGKRGLPALLRIVIRRRMIDEIRSYRQCRKVYGRSPLPMPISLEAIMDQGDVHVMDMPATEAGRAPAEVMDRCAELFALQLTDIQERVLEMLAMGWGRQRIWERLGIGESRLCQIIAGIRRAHERARGMRRLRGGDPPGARALDDRLAGRSQDRGLPAVPSHGRMGGARRGAAARAAGGGRRGCRVGRD